MAYRTDLLTANVATILASAARTATPTLETFACPPSTGLIVHINVTAITATPSVVFTIYGYDPVSAQTWPILVSAAVTATGETTLRVSPHLTAAANLIAADIVPPFIQIDAVHGDADSITYSVGAHIG